ncbi:MAG: hypothetical protein HYS23_13990 [Geobacter sp.]|nr:hypothetical protein [Geobacter sp.]
MLLNTAVTKYLKTRAITVPWRIEGCDRKALAGAVVIPALAESSNLPATLLSLAANPAELLERFLVLVVVNNRPDAPERDMFDNLATLEFLREAGEKFAPLNLAWVDAASPGLELPAKGGGVGMARKIGLDLALTRLISPPAAPLLISLDADTLVRPDYLPAIIGHFAQSAAGGAVIPFSHQPASDPAEQSAIDRYELFLRSYVLGLSLAGSPYAFHTVGSAMACTATAYVKAGGMNSRAAGEDFYFLQQLFRTSGVTRMRGTMVHPSPRPSHRVPFGTGRAISRTLAGDDGAVMFYRPECFHILGEWLKLPMAEKGAAAIMAAAAAVSPHLVEFLETAGFAGTWENLRRNHRDTAALRSAFHGWFDGLRTMKLVHHLSAGPFPRCEPEEALPPLCAQAGFPSAGAVGGWLNTLRDVQNS